MAENKTLKTRLVLRHDIASNWKTNNPVLLNGEIGLETDTYKLKVGDGVNSWNDLRYYISPMGFYEATVENGGDHIVAINEVVGSAAKEIGDIAIVKETISGDKVAHTGYIWDGSTWKAMDGNYNAENVYFDQDLVTTSAIGNITLQNGQATISAAGKNLKQVFDTIFVKAKDPSITQPSVSITLTGAGAKEVGTEFTPGYSVSFNAGNYQYGPATGVTATYAVTDTASHSSTTATGSFEKFTVEEGTDYSISVTASHTAGTNPKNNIGEEKANLAIVAGSKTATSSKVTGFRGWFQGYYNGTQAIADPTAITSSQIRAFGVKNGAFTTSVNTNQMKQMFFAAPKGVVKDIKVANAVNGAPQTVNKTSVQVEGANNFAAVEYDLFYVSNAVAESGASKFTITVTK